MEGKKHNIKFIILVVFDKDDKPHVVYLYYESTL